MKTTCENCFTIYDLPKEKQGLSGCPYCEHINKPKKAIPLSSAPQSLGMDPSQTMLTYVQGERKNEVSAVQKMIQGKIPNLLPNRAFILTILEGEEKGKRFLLNKPVIQIGRRETDLNLRDPEVSRQHCVVQIYGEMAIIRDLKSANGTWVNGLMIQEDFLKDQDKIRIGRSTMQLSIEEPPMN